MINGRRAICESWRTLREQRGVRELSLTVQQVEVSEDMAYHLGDGSMRLQEAEGQTRSVPFTYVIIWRRRPDGAWKIVVDIVSSEAPVGRER